MSKKSDLRKQFDNIIQDTLASQDEKGEWFGYDTTVDVDNAYEQIAYAFEDENLAIQRLIIGWQQAQLDRIKDLLANPLYKKKHAIKLIEILKEDAYKTETYKQFARENEKIKEQ